MNKATQAPGALLASYALEPRHAFNFKFNAAGNKCPSYFSGNCM